MTAPATFTGADHTREYLLEVHPDGTRVIATRPVGSPHSWGPPVELTAASDVQEVCS